MERIETKIIEVDEETFNRKYLTENRKPFECPSLKVVLAEENEKISVKFKNGFILPFKAGDLYCLAEKNYCSPHIKNIPSKDRKFRAICPQGHTLELSVKNFKKNPYNNII